MPASPYIPRLLGATRYYLCASAHIRHLLVRLGVCSPWPCNYGRTLWTPNSKPPRLRLATSTRVTRPDLAFSESEVVLRLPTRTERSRSAQYRRIPVAGTYPPPGKSLPLHGTLVRPLLQGQTANSMSSSIPITTRIRVLWNGLRTSTAQIAVVSLLNPASFVAPISWPHASTESSRVGRRLASYLDGSYHANNSCCVVQIIVKTQPNRAACLYLPM